MGWEEGLGDWEEGQADWGEGGAGWEEEKERVALEVREVGKEKAGMEEGDMPERCPLPGMSERGEAAAEVCACGSRRCACAAVPLAAAWPASQGYKWSGLNRRQRWSFNALRGMVAGKIAQCTKTTPYRTGISTVVLHSRLHQMTRESRSTRKRRRESQSSYWVLHFCLRFLQRRARMQHQRCHGINECTRNGCSQLRKSACGRIPVVVCNVWIRK